MARDVKRVCLAYSGGLDTSVILHWLTEQYGCEDGVDNDEDGFTDFPADAGCSSATDHSERPESPLPALSGTAVAMLLLLLLLVALAVLAGGRQECAAETSSR